MLWQRFLVVRPTAIVIGTAQHAAVYRRTAVQHPIPGVLARVPEPTTAAAAAATGWVFLVRVGRRQGGHWRRRFVVHGFQSPPNTQLAPAPLLLR